MNEHKSMTEEELAAMLEDLGLRPSEDDPYPIWRRWKCRILGPHDWVPVYELEPDSGALIEDGNRSTRSRFPQRRERGADEALQAASRPEAARPGVRRTSP